MKAWPVLFALTAIEIALPRPAQAADSGPEMSAVPSAGIELLASGVTLSSMGALILATSPICKTGVVNAPEQGSCFATTFLIGTPILALGIPFIVVGAVQHRSYQDWARRHPNVGGLSITPSRSGLGVGWSTSF